MKKCPVYNKNLIPLLTSLTNWKPVTNQTIIRAPSIHQSTFEISDEPTDTFLDMSAWHKGIVFVNGFNIGRYFRAGPPQTLYVPGPLLKNGTNTVYDCTHYSSSCF